MADKHDEDQVDEELKLPFDPHASRLSRILSVLLPSIFGLIVLIFCLIYGVIPGPEFLLLCFFIYAYYNNWSRRFVKDLAPLLMMFLSSEVLYSVVGILANSVLVVHFVEPYYADKLIFGQIPPILFQNLFRAPIMDYVTTFFYSTHFAVPTVFAFLLWKLSPKDCKKYTLAFGLVTYSALVTYLVYPVAPPWANSTLVSDGLVRVLFSVDKTLGVPVYKSIFDILQADPYAAFPSLHSAFPWLITLFSFRIWKAKAIPVLVLPIGVWFSVIYLGEHYVVDIFGGVAYSTAAFIIAVWVVPYLQSKYRLRKRKMNQDRDYSELPTSESKTEKIRIGERFSYHC